MSDEELDQLIAADDLGLTQPKPKRTPQTTEEARLEKLVLTLLSSNSWRLTAPLRRMRATAHRASARLAISLRDVLGHHPPTKAPRA